MEFWGAEVKCGQPLKVVPGNDMVLHLSQACLGELKKDKGNESVCLFVNVDGKKLVLGTLFSEKLPQQQFDLVFDKDFELSHNWKNGSVYFYGYKATNPYEDFLATESQGEESDESDEEDIPLVTANLVKPEVEAKPVKPAEADKASASKSKQSDAGKNKVKIVEPIKDVDPEEDDDDSCEDAMYEDEDDSEDEEDEDDSEEDSDESDEETPTPKKKPESSKKRAADSAIKTPVQEKKAKVTPQKTDGKKVSGHVATPHPAKQAAKTPATKQTPQSGGSSITCKSCSRQFGSEKALESHSKAKHSAAK